MNNLSFFLPDRSETKKCKVQMRKELIDSCNTLLDLHASAQPAYSKKKPPLVARTSYRRTADFLRNYITKTF